MRENSRQDVPELPLAGHGGKPFERCKEILLQRRGSLWIVNSDKFPEVLQVLERFGSEDLRLHRGYLRI